MTPDLSYCWEGEGESSVRVMNGMTKATKWQDENALIFLFFGRFRDPIHQTERAPSRLPTTCWPNHASPGSSHPIGEKFSKNNPSSHPWLKQWMRVGRREGAGVGVEGGETEGGGQLLGGNAALRKLNACSRMAGVGGGFRFLSCAFFFTTGCSPPLEMMSEHVGPQNRRNPNEVTITENRPRVGTTPGHCWVLDLPKAQLVRGWFYPQAVFTSSFQVYFPFRPPPGSTTTAIRKQSTPRPPPPVLYLLAFIFIAQSMRFSLPTFQLFIFSSIFIERSL